MPRRSHRRAPKRSSRREATRSKSSSPITWAINFVIAALVVVVIGFVYSSIHRIRVNNQAVDLSLEESINKYDNNLPAQLYEKKQYPDIWVEVLNGNGVPGVANDFTNYLRDKGFDVQRTDNADAFTYGKTLVMNRSNQHRKAVAVAQALQIDTSLVRDKPDPTLQLDVTVILGKDYKGLAVYKTMQNVMQ